MMGDVRDVNPDLDKMDGQLDKVEDALQPLLGNLAEVSSQLPLLDRAKLFALTAYSIESLLFCQFSPPPKSSLHLKKVSIVRYIECEDHHI